MPLPLWSQAHLLTCWTCSRRNLGISIEWKHGHVTDLRTSPSTFIKSFELSDLFEVTCSRGKIPHSFLILLLLLCQFYQIGTLTSFLQFLGSKASLCFPLLAPPYQWLSQNNSVHSPWYHLHLKDELFLPGLLPETVLRRGTQRLRIFEVYQNLRKKEVVGLNPFLICFINEG